MAGKNGQTIGYWYIMTMLDGLWRGPIDALLAIEADKKIAWQGEATDSAPHAINSPNLFGGEKKEGGLQGGFRLLQGARTQIVPPAQAVSIGGTGPVPSIVVPNIRNSIGGMVSQLRGFASIVYRGTVCAMNPYPKEWHFLGYRAKSGWYNDQCWYPAKATICMTTGTAGEVVRGMNPAHIVYQVLTDPEWGAAQPTDALDENSFILAANTLCDERFGLCLNWTRQEDVDTFLQTVMDHIAGVLYTDRNSGKIVLRLIRNDYAVGDVPLYDENSGLLSVEDDDSASNDEAINEIIVKGKDQTLEGFGDDFEVRAHNPGGRGQEGIISQTVELPGLATRELAQRVAQRELRVHACGLKRLKLRLDRRAYRVVPGGVIAIASVRNDIQFMILRVGDVDYGTDEDPAITVKAMEDVFGMPESAFQTPVSKDWQAPNFAALPATNRRLIEAGYRDILLTVTQSQMSNIQPTDVYIGELAASPGYAYQYDLATKADGETDFEVRALGSFTYFGTLGTTMDGRTTVLTLTANAGLAAEYNGQALLIDDEIVVQTNFDPVAHTIEVARGCADTIPSSHSIGVKIWLLDDDLVSDRRVYVAGETVNAKVLTRTSSDVLSPDDAPTDTLTLIGRQNMPYPPGNVTVNNISVYGLDALYAEPVIRWTHRDRISQADTLVAHIEPSVGPETGVTYNLRVFASPTATSPIRTMTGLTGTSWTYDASMQAADGSPALVAVELESERGGVKSWQKYRFNVPISSSTPEAPTPRASLNFKDGVYSLNGVSKTLSEVVTSSSTAGAFSESDVVSGTGLTISSSSANVRSRPVLTADAFAAITAGDATTGITAVLHLNIATASEDAGAEIYVSFEDYDTGTLYQGYCYYQGSSPDSASLNDNHDAYQTFDIPTAGAHKLGFVLASTGLVESLDGGAPLSTGAAAPNPATRLVIAVGAFPWAGASATSTVEKIEFFERVDAATLQAMTA